MDINLGDAQVSSLALSPEFQIDRLGFAGTNLGLLVTRDGGQTWQDALASLGLEAPLPVTSVIYVPRQMKAARVVAGIYGGFLQSEDNGQTWQVISPASPPAVVTALAAAQNGDLYAGTAQDGIFIAQDGGKWIRWNFGLLDWHIFCVAAVRWADGSQVCFAGVETGVFYSLNSGRAWHETDFPIDAGAVLSLAVSEESERVFAGTETGSLFRSRDRGRSWERISEGVFRAEISALILDGDRLLAASGNKLLVSHDGGESWREWNAQAQVTGAILSAAIHSGPGTGALLFAGSTDGKIHVISEAQVII